MPNRDGEIHLDNCRTKQNIWQEYYKQRKEDEGFSKPLNYDAFLKMWGNCMPHVKIRKDKVRASDSDWSISFLITLFLFEAVDTKCDLCTDLAEQRMKATTRQQRLELNRLHHYHRLMFMGERLTYYERNAKSRNGEDCLSTIGDGMQQVSVSQPRPSRLLILTNLGAPHGPPVAQPTPAPGGQRQPKLSDDRHCATGCFDPRQGPGLLSALRKRSQGP